jgi:hypothetical protein
LLENISKAVMVRFSLQIRPYSTAISPVCMLLSYDSAFEVYLEMMLTFMRH